MKQQDNLLVVVVTAAIASLYLPLERVQLSIFQSTCMPGRIVDSSIVA